MTTGIQGLDAHFGGGVPSGSTILLLSEPSNAPYVFCEQFAAGGLNAGETVYYYNIERPKEEVVNHIKPWVTDAKALKELKYLDLYSVKMRDLSVPVQKQLGIENHAVKLNEDILPRLLRHPKDAPFRVIVESLTEAIQAYGLEPTLAMLNALTGVIKSLGGTALVMMVRGLHDANVEMKMRHLVDGVIEFGVDRQGFGLYSYLSVTKMRGVQDPVRLLLYKETDKGLWLESTRRVI